MAHDVFVSHSSKDKTTADAVVALLESQGIRCWVAPRDIVPGVEWGEAIVQAIKGSRVMVLVFSTNANTSVQINREVERAVHFGKPVIPLRIEDVVPAGSLEYFLSAQHWLDAYTPPLDKHLRYLAEIIRPIIDGVKTQVPPAPSAGPFPRPQIFEPPVPATEQPTPAEEPATPVPEVHKSKLPLVPAAALGLALLVLIVWHPWIHRAKPTPPPALSTAATVQPEEAPDSPASAKTPIPSMTDRWTNSLGQIFVPVAGTPVMFCIWDTRVEDFQAFVQATGYATGGGMYSMDNGQWGQHGDTWQNPGFTQVPTCPVVGVSWHDAKNYCAWLTQKERAEGLISEQQSYRLPMDWEWSVAIGLKESREGTPKDKNGQMEDVYPWGHGWPPPNGSGNYAGSEARDGNWPATWTTIDGFQDGFARRSPVGSFRADESGLYDLSGNVRVWCEDVYDEMDETRNEEDKNHVIRGASWADISPVNLLSSFRDKNTPNFRNSFVGFRCALVTEPKQPSEANAGLTATKTYANLNSRWTNGLGQIFVPVPGTKVLFCIWDTRVQDYRAYANANLGEVDGSWQTPYFHDLQVTPQATCPVVMVSWNDANAFCAWLTKQEQASGLISQNQRYRLPTDFEWSVAVGLNESREESPAGKSMRIQGVYPWGTQWPPPPGTGNYADETAKRVLPDLPILNGYDDGYAGTSPVGAFPANQFGLYDLSGNVAQWCQDKFEPGAEGRTLRGISWHEASRDYMLSSVRYVNPPDLRGTVIGFRCVLANDESPPPGQPAM